MTTHHFDDLVELSADAPADVDVLLTGAMRTNEKVLAAIACAIAVVGLVVAGTQPSTAPVGDGRIPAPTAVPDDLPDPVRVTDDVREAALDAAGCEVLVPGEPLADRDHLDPDDAPPAAALYPERPAHSGRHYGSLLEVPDRIPPAPIDERAVLHNMEHGSVVVWLDLDRVGRDEVADAQAWMRERRSQGFESRAAGGIWVSPAEAITSGKAVALRAWGVAVDCDRFDRTVADAFLQEFWGSNGQSPEANLSPFPAGPFGEVGNAV